MSNEAVQIARDELRQAKQEARCGSVGGRGTPWLDSLWPLGFMSAAVACASASWLMLAAYWFIVAVVMGVPAARGWWRAGVRAGIDYERANSTRGDQ